MAFTQIQNGTTADADDINQVIKALDGTSGGGQPVAMTQLNDSSNYALDVRNLDSTNGYVARFRDEASAAIATLTRASITLGKKIIATGLGTFTTATNLIDIAATWNGAAVTFMGLKLNITNTASAAASRLIDLQVGGSSKFSVDTAGVIQTGTISGAQLTDATVTSAKIVDGTIATADIADGAVTAAKIATGVMPAIGILMGAAVDDRHVESGTVQLSGTSASVTFANAFASGPNPAFAAVGTFDDYKTTSPTTTGMTISSVNSNNAYVGWIVEGPD